MTVAAALMLRASARRSLSNVSRRTDPLSSDLLSAGRSNGGGNGRRPRFYSSSAPSLSEAVAAKSDADGDAAGPTKVDPRVAAHRYNNSRAAYQRDVSVLRKKYAVEYKRRKDAEDAERARERARLTRSRLERQRAKDTRSGINAAKELRKREVQAVERELEYQEAGRLRDVREDRMMKARALLLEELEGEAPHWMTSPQEVEAALGNDEASQILWGRPGGVIGAPRVGGDANPYWRYECHHWDMARTYKSPRELLLEDLEDMAFADVNLDERYWTPDRIAAAETREEKAKLRAMVREEGRKRLLQRQREMMQDQRAREVAQAERERGAALPMSMPAPHLGVLADVEAQELEGAKVLLEEDPAKFFRFDGDGDFDSQEAILDAVDGGVQAGNVGHAGVVEDATAKLLQRGQPTGLRDPLRDSNGGTPYPAVLGRLPQRDDRTDAQKKRDEREARMWEAARRAEEEAKRSELSGAMGGGQKNVNKDVESAAEDTVAGAAGTINYDEFVNSPSDFDREWEEGLDPLNPEDAAALATPAEFRFTEEDVDWVLEKLQSKADRLQEFAEMEQETELTMARVDGDNDATGAAPEDDFTKSAQRTEGVDSRGQKFTQYDLEDYTPDPNASVDDLLGQLDAAEKMATEGGDLPDELASIVTKKPPARAASPLAPVEDPELDRLAKQLGLEDILDELDESDMSRLDKLLSSDPELNTSVEDAMSTFTEGELKKLNDLNIDDLGEEIQAAMQSMDVEGSDTLDEGQVMEALQKVLPDMSADKLEKLVALEMELERDASVRKAVLGGKKKTVEEQEPPAKEEEEGEEFDVVDVDAAAAPRAEKSEDEGDDEKKP